MNISLFGDTATKVNKSTKNFNLLLYPEDYSHMNALRYLKKHEQLFKFVYILHDKDVEDDKLENVSRETNQLIEANKPIYYKKAHYHVTITFPDRRTVKSVSRFLGINENYVQECNSLVSSVLYMIHDTPDSQYKHQYSPDEIKGDISMKALAITQSQTAMYFNLLYQIARNCDNQYDFIDSILGHEDCAEQLLSVLARYQLTFNTILNQNKINT